MMFLRLLPMILADVLFAAHILRSHGMVPTLIILLFLLTLFIRRPWIPKMWQILLLLSVAEWIRTTATFVHFRLAMQMPYFRLLLIMGLVILFFVFVIFWWNNKKIQQFYQSGIEKGGEEN